ncbi:hypothetical protein FQR65_LT10313 [Abscondita terminalis]|nr:hypothetical protein FQR65_LT10313 [Abscondita terminalis]
MRRQISPSAARIPKSIPLADRELSYKTPWNITIRSPGIWPINKNTFEDKSYVPASVTYEDALPNTPCETVEEQVPETEYSHLNLLPTENEVMEIEDNPG